MIEPSTLLVESTDWSSAAIRATSLCLALGQWNKPPSECTPSISSYSEVVRDFPYSCFIDLLCELLIVTSLHLHESELAINTVSSVNVCLVVIPRILLALSKLVPIRARFPVVKSQASKLCSSGHVLLIVHEVPSETSPSASEFHVPPRSVHIRIHPISLPNFLCTFFKVALQVTQNSLCLPRAFQSILIAPLNIPSS